MRTLRPRDRYGLRHRSVFVRAVMTRPTALRKSALEGRGVVVLLLPSSSSGGVVLRAVVVPHLAHFPESVLRSIHFLSLALSLSEKRRKRRLLLATVTSVAGMKSSIVCARALSLSLCVSESGDKESEFKTSAFFLHSKRAGNAPERLKVCFSARHEYHGRLLRTERG